MLQVPSTIYISIYIWYTLFILNTNLHHPALLLAHTHAIHMHNGCTCSSYNMTEIETVLHTDLCIYIFLNLQLCSLISATYWHWRGSRKTRNSCDKVLEEHRLQRGKNKEGRKWVLISSVFALSTTEREEINKGDEPEKRRRGKATQAVMWWFRPITTLECVTAFPCIRRSMQEQNVIARHNDANACESVASSCQRSTWQTGVCSTWQKKRSGTDFRREGFTKRTRNKGGKRPRN